MEKKILISVGSIVSNKGSEALVRGVAKICKEKYPNSHITLSALEMNFGDWMNIEGVDKYIRRYSFKNDKSIKRYCSTILRKIFKLNKLSNIIKYKDFLEEAKKSDFVIMIGADNYDKNYNMIDSLHEFHSFIRSNTNAKMVLYDCSLAKEDISEKFKEDIKLFDYITVREQLSLSNVKDVIKKNKLFYYPDPAFVMETKKTDLPENWCEGKMIGINLSNLITEDKYGSNVETVKKTYQNLIEYIINETDYHIAFIPHVMKQADLSTLKPFYEEYKNSGKVVLIDNENLSAPELKYIISKCRLFVGARTHSTIAAYSTNVPTLVLGYSIKSLGIAKDLFNTNENYVIPVSNLQTTLELVNGFKWLDEKQEEIRQTLLQKIPDYKIKAAEFSKLLK